MSGKRVREVSACSHPDRRQGVADDTVAVPGMLGADGVRVIQLASAVLESIQSRCCVASE